MKKVMVRLRVKIDRWKCIELYIDFQMLHMKKVIINASSKARESTPRVQACARSRARKNI
jgi:hypothetical protein